MEGIADALMNHAVVAVVGSAVGAVASAFAIKWKSKPDVQAVTNAAVAGIIQHYTQALTDQTKEVHELRGEIAEMRDTIEAQSREIAELNNHIVDLSAALNQHGITPPPRRQSVLS